MARAQAVAVEVAAPLAAKIDEGRWPEEAIRALQAEGMGGLTAPATSGGSGLGLRALVEVCEVLGRACASTAITYGMHAVGTAVIAAKATPTQSVSLLEPISAGRHLTTLALSEPGTGSQFWLPQTRLRREDATYVLDGTKSFVTNGSRADSYVMSTVAAEPDAPAGQFSCVVVPDPSDGLVWADQWHGLGMRGNSSRGARLEGVRVPVANLLGAEGDQIWYVFEVVAPYFLMAMSGTYLGIAHASLLEARDHLLRRQHTHTGRSLAGEPVVQHRLGELWARVERTRRLAFWAAEEAETGGPDALPGLASAKAEVADCAVGVANEVMTLMGGIAYRDRAPVERHLRDARAAHVMSPTTDTLRTWTGRALLGMPLLGS
ncbi:isovaleryl-CoA dehydrogenase [Cellulomonas bogoriensis 69B4 = DSM 16987]|uniref:Isovaleryl-CoA dehydrogenase n=1 Tax=Cellulomonas bogoriensis 69B4 = DSM 16987 TaxID=1386082 RepID=A0A0A0BZV2_9CELL|nr:isovaleryl-CoA dehydrogenase [Cellulomonas bogoriensis 69B4 = DSM 16987]